MKSKSLVKLLRRIIREEVQAAVKQVLNEKKTDHKQVISHGMDLSRVVERRRPTQKKSFTKNNVLNDLLNETAETADFASMQEGPLVSQDYPSIGSFKSDMAESFGMSRQPQALATTDVNGAPVNMQNEAVAKTVDIMTKDYSQLMKAIDKKDKAKGKR